MEGDVMSEPFNLRPISITSIPRALEKAERYRLLNEPEQAESICLDILEAESGNQRALVTLILALTDRFGMAGAPPNARRASDYLARLTDEYQRNYYGGIVRERQAWAYLRRGMARAFAYDAFREAMDCFEKAAAIPPEGDDEALLRWNACVRTIRRANLRPRPEEPEQPLE
jgi:tetratricopeptide (TPR) repeat protein